MTDCNVELKGRLYAVQDIIAAAEAQFAETEDHHRYYGDCFNAVQEAITRISPCTDEDVERVGVALEREFPECIDEGRMGFVMRLARAAISAMNQIRSTDHE